MITSVLLDLDGTLTDPALGITNRISYALTRLDAAVPPTNDCGKPFRATTNNHSGADHAMVETPTWWL